MNAMLHTIEVAGIIAFASSGFIEARRKRMDIVGVFTVAFITAFGGGTLRDLLLDRRPLFWVENQQYPILVFVLALIAMPFLRHLRHAVTESVLEWADALGLGLFSVTGTSLALEAEMPVFICAMMGVITGIFGGVLRDVICNEIPLVFRRSQLYATCAFSGCWVFLFLNWLQASEALSLLAGICTTFALRILAIRFDWKLPA
ncbi:trimeric intracellular cation channel family protein [Undibacterium oligocarboniphilum]|uniref:Trimeric intracellular cation channel family protein n=1 Tax=Undibacterium oligocarboniphilum TaxID=666702 RepID=A0A850QL50_9BURK|nr:trimeric intracellular cation channel family protein [Undibacterium oligocarboniphilum]MBC3869144.1 trimeric intracellular cation channel family protein [Undibacterium oligocarboniphilum]NVO77124.1 trimeric intracellular cation channel family protein [Undibacterium oligocarboniphilum]